MKKFVGELGCSRNSALPILTHKTETFERGSGETGHELRLLLDDPQKVSRGQIENIP